MVLFAWKFALVVGSSLAATSREEALLNTWDKALGAEDAAGTPVTRVVNLLKEMQATLKKEMDEEEEMYEKEACFCNNNKYEKNEAIETAEQQIDSLTSKIESLTAKNAELKSLIGETTKELEADKEELATATELRQKQLKAFHQDELDAIQNVENLKAAIIVLGKHAGFFPQISLLSLGSHHTHKHKNIGGGKEGLLDRQLDSFMLENGYAMRPETAAENRAVAKFLQEKNDDKNDAARVSHTWSAHEKSVVQRAIRTASIFMQTKGESGIDASGFNSGEILGIMKQLKEEMESDLSEGQKQEAERSAAFDELRTAKSDEIASGEKLLEEKKEELAQVDFDLANAKEDLEMITAQLGEDQKFLASLTKACDEKEKAYEANKKERLAEIQAVSETIEILTSDEARDAMNGAFKFIQMSMRTRRMSGKRTLAAKALRAAFSRTKGSGLSVLATSVELDSFTKIKKMMDELVAKLKLQQADEVKKNDWCKSEFQENEMQTMKAEDLQKDQEVQIEDLASAIKTLGDEIASAKSAVSKLQTDMQRAGETRLAENKEFQMTVADQVATQEILAKAADRLASFFEMSFVQVGRSTRRVAAHQKEMEDSEGPASGILSMIEKLIYDAKELEAEAKKDEGDAQAQYETFVADTNASVKELQEAVVTKSETKAKAEKELVETEEALQNTITDLEDLSKYKAGLHEDCDFVLKNFGIRQEGRAAEIEALQQAKQILSGAA